MQGGVPRGDEPQAAGRGVHAHPHCNLYPWRCLWQCHLHVTSKLTILIDCYRPDCRPLHACALAYGYSLQAWLMLCTFVMAPVKTSICCIISLCPTLYALLRHLVDMLCRALQQLSTAGCPETIHHTTGLQRSFQTFRCQSLLLGFQPSTSATYPHKRR